MPLTQSDYLHKFLSLASIAEKAEFTDGDHIDELRFRACMNAYPPRRPVERPPKAASSVPSDALTVTAGTCST